jgi:hypothetical protein
MKTGALLLLIATFGAFAQFPGQTIPGQYPGQYPPGGYPGQYPGNGRQMPGPSLPGRSRTSRKADTAIPTDTVTGMLRKASANEVVIETSDHRIIHVTTNRATKYVATDSTGRSAEIQSLSLEPGDHLTIQANRDDQNYFIAVEVRLDKKGTASERAAASQPLGETISSGTGSSDTDDDRPRLKRSGASDTQPDAPRAAPAAAAAPAPEPEQPSRAATTIEPAPAPRDIDDPGPPVLRRNRTFAQRSEPADQSPRTEIAQAQQPAASPRPSLNDPLIVAPPIPEADPVVAERPRQNNALPGEDPIIAAARDAADSFTETLPNYIVKQVTTRYQTGQAAGQKTSWQALDVVTSDLVMENGRETYKNVLVNGKAPRQAIEKTGSWSNGEFASMLQLVLYRGSDAEFHGKRSSTIANRAAWRYDYSVEQPNSHWTLEASGQSYEPAYNGSIWIDKETSRVLRIEMAARRIPSDFPLDSAESTVDYDFVLLGDKKFLVPTHSEVLSCQRGTPDCSRNVIDFRNYRKFGTDTTITFEKDPR